MAEYVADLAMNATRKSGTRVSTSQVIAALLERARAEGWQVEPAALTTHRPE